MFGNYLRVAIRNLLKNPLYSAINVAGLALGLAACMLIALFVQDEMTYDQFWAKSDRIYRPNATFLVPGREPIDLVQTPGPMKAAIKSYFPNEIEHSTRIMPLRPLYQFEKTGQVETHEVVTHFVDPEFADIFDLKILEGDIRAVLADTTSIAIPRRFAEQHYGTTSGILGEEVRLQWLGKDRIYKIGAVFDNLPHNTVMYLNVIAMLDEAEYADFPWLLDTWFSINSYNFYTIKEGVDASLVGNRLKEFIDATVVMPENGPAPPGTKASAIMRYNHQALTDVQLNPFGVGEMKATGDIYEVIIFASIALAILLVGCINFINLSTAKATQRAREVALRKVHGADRKQLMLQFIGETLLVAVLALLIAIAVVELSVGVFGDTLGKELSISYSEPATWFTLGGLTLFVGLAGGAYPAFIVSGFLPSRILRANKSGDGGDQGWLRQSLVIVQFTVSITLMIATAVVYSQMQYAKTIDPGYERENRLIIRNTGQPGIEDQQAALRQSMLSLPGVTGASYTMEIPSSGSDGNSLLFRAEATSEERIVIGNRSFDPHFVDVFGVKLLAGRGFSADRPTDREPTSDEVSKGERKAGVIMVNRTALAKLGIATPKDAIGEVFMRNIGEDENGKAIAIPFTIIGVLEDHRFQSLRQPVRPEIYTWHRFNNQNLALAFTGNPVELVDRVRAVWAEQAPGVPFSPEFVQDLTLAEFVQEEAQGMLLLAFSVFAVLIACLGLYGLAVFTADRRTKEIGVRKVMGANVIDIVRLLVWQFSKPVILANLIAWPLASYAMINWLEQFPFRMDVWFLLPLSAFASLLALVIAWVTVGGNAALVARTNPIQALRYE